MTGSEEISEASRGQRFARWEALGLDDVKQHPLDGKGFFFRASPRHNATMLTEQPMTQPDACRMIRRRAAAAGIKAPIGNRSFRATGITAYLADGGALAHGQETAAHDSPRTTRLYDRTKERLTQDEVGRIRL